MERENTSLDLISK